MNVRTILSTVCMGLAATSASCVMDVPQEPGSRAEALTEEDAAASCSAEEVAEAADADAALECVELLPCGQTSANPHETSGTCRGSATECRECPDDPGTPTNETEDCRRGCEQYGWGDVEGGARTALASECGRQCDYSLAVDVRCDRGPMCNEASCLEIGAADRTCKTSPPSFSRSARTFGTHVCCTVEATSSFQATGHPACSDCDVF